MSAHSQVLTNTALSMSKIHAFLILQLHCCCLAKKQYLIRMCVNKTKQNQNRLFGPNNKKEQN